MAEVEANVGDPKAGRSRPALLCRLKPQPGETRTVQFELSAADLAFVNGASQLATETGEFEVMIANLKAKFRYEQ